MNTYIFLCDLDYYPDENYEIVISAESFDKAFDAWIEHYNRDCEKGTGLDKIKDADDLLGDRITEVIELTHNGYYNHYSIIDRKWVCRKYTIITKY